VHGVTESVPTSYDERPASSMETSCLTLEEKICGEPESHNKGHEVLSNIIILVMPEDRTGPIQGSLWQTHFLPSFKLLTNQTFPGKINNSLKDLKTHLSNNFLGM
jgi:hypothetical protein